MVTVMVTGWPAATWAGTTVLTETRASSVAQF